MTGRRWFEHQALPAVAAVAVAVGLYAWRGGHYPLPVDLMALTAMGLFVYMGVRQLALSARFRNEDTKENNPMSTYIRTPEEFEALRQAATTLEIPADLPRWHPNEISEWMTEVADDETASDDDRRRAALAEAYALGIDPDDVPTAD